MAKEAPARYTTPRGRVLFVNAFKARAAEGDDGEKGTPKYSITLVFDPAKFTESDKKKFSALVAAVNKETKDSFKLKDYDFRKPGSFKPGIRKLEDRVPPFEGDGLPEVGYFLNASSLFKPGVVDLNGNDVAPEEGNEDILYRGCYARATLNLFAFDKRGNKGISFQLNNIQVLGDGKRLDNRRSASEEFADEEVDGAWLEGDEPEVEDEDY